MAENLNYFSWIFSFDNFSGVGQPYKGLFGEEDVSKIDMAYRVIADHIRTLTIALGKSWTTRASGRKAIQARLQTVAMN